MTEIEKAVIKLINAGDEIIDCTNCCGVDFCIEHENKFWSKFQELRRLVREKQGVFSRRSF